MSIRSITLVVIAVALVMLGFSLWAAPRLPAQVPSHWNAAGQVDGYSSPSFAMYFLPALTLGVGLLLIYLPRIDPLRANVDKFRPIYHWAVAGFALYFAYIHVLTLLAGLGLGVNMTSAMLPAFSLLFIGLGFLIERTQQNWFIGIRTPWTLSSPVVWQKTHKMGGLLFKVCGLLSLVGLLFPFEIAFILMIVPAMIAAFGSIVYSYIVFRQEQSR